MTIANCPGISKIATTKMTVQPAPPSRSLSLFHIIFHMICLKRCRLTIAERRPLSFRLPRLKTSENTNERSPHPRNRRAAALVRHSPQPRKEENCGSDSFVARGLQISAAKCAAQKTHSLACHKPWRPRLQRLAADQCRSEAIRYRTGCASSRRPSPRRSDDARPTRTFFRRSTGFRSFVTGSWKS